MYTRTRITWRNTVRKFKSQPLKYFEPETIDDVVSIIREAEKKNLRVRAVGSGHSFNDVAITDGYLINPWCMNHIQLYDKSLVKNDWSGEHLVDMEAGIVLRDMNRWLDKNDLAVVNMGAIDHQTISGAISTGTHGSGISLVAVSGMVRSLMLATKGGEVLRIEPTDGITDPAKYADKKIKLVQDDDMFYSVVVSLGCMGIICSFVLRVMPMYWLEESKTLTTWSKVKPQLADRSIFTGTRGLMVQVNPYEINGDHSCNVVRIRKAPRPVRRSFGDRTRNIMSTLLGNFKLMPYITLFLIQNFPKRIPKIVESAIKSLKDKKYINKAQKVLFQGSVPVKEKAYDCEGCFNIDNLDNTFILALESLFELANKFSKEGNLYLSSPVSLRFVDKSKAYLTPESGRTVCYIDTPFVAGTEGADEMLNYLQDNFLAHGGMLHWGKVNNRLDGKSELIRKWYTKFPIWQKYFLQFNANGTFSNNFSERMRFGEKA